MLAFICVIFNLALLGFVGSLAGLTSRTLIQPEALILVFTPQILFVVVNLGMRKGYPVIRRLVSGAPNLSNEEIVEAIISLGLIYGFLGGCMGTAICLGQLADPKAIGRGLAFALGSLFYGIVPSILVLPGRIKAQGLQSNGIRVYVVVAVFLLGLCGATVLAALLRG